MEPLTPCRHTGSDPVHLFRYSLTQAPDVIIPSYELYIPCTGEAERNEIVYACKHTHRCRTALRPGRIGVHDSLQAPELWVRYCAEFYCSEGKRARQITFPSLPRSSTAVAWERRGCECVPRLLRLETELVIAQTHLGGQSL